MKEDDVVVVSSDSEEDEEIVWMRKTQNKQYQLLSEKIKPILYYQVQPGYKLSTTFPYAKFQELANDLKKSLALVNVKSTQAFIWKNLIRWLVSIKLCYENVSDCINDRNYNLILTDFMAQYVNYKCQLYSSITDETEVALISNEIVVTLSLVFSGWVPGILMTLLKIQVIDDYRLILYPIFKKYLSNKHLHETNDLISYLRLILCFRKWKKLAHLKEDKEIINEIAVGKSAKALRSDIIDLSTETASEPVLPKTVPSVNEDNRIFANITGLIGFASKNQEYGTRILLINKTLELDDTIEQFFKRYNEYINRSTPKLLECSRAGIKPILIEDLTRSPSPDQLLSRTSYATRETSQIFNKNKSNGKQGTKAVNQHLSNNCDISSISVNNKFNHLNLNSHQIENLSPSCKNIPQNRNNDVLLSLRINNVVDIVDTNDEDDNNEKDTCLLGQNSNANSMSAFEKRIAEAIDSLKDRALFVGDLVSRVNVERINNPVVAAISSDEAAQTNGESPVVHAEVNNVVAPIPNPVPMRASANPSNEVPVEKPIRKRHGIVSSTTSFEGTGNDSDNSDDDYGLGVHNRFSFSQRSFYKVVEEATSSTNEIPRTPSNFANQPRRSISSSPCQTRPSSASPDRWSNISPSSTIRSGCLSRLGIASGTSITAGKMISSITDEEQPTCSRYVAMPVLSASLPNHEDTLQKVEVQDSSPEKQTLINKESTTSINIIERSASATDKSENGEDKRKNVSEVDTNTSAVNELLKNISGFIGELQEEYGFESSKNKCGPDKPPAVISETPTIIDKTIKSTDIFFENDVEQQVKTLKNASQQSIVLLDAENDSKNTKANTEIIEFQENSTEATIVENSTEKDLNDENEKKSQPDKPAVEEPNHPESNPDKKFIEDEVVTTIEYDKKQSEEIRNKLYLTGVYSNIRHEEIVDKMSTTEMEQTKPCADDGNLFEAIVEDESSSMDDIESPAYEPICQNESLDTPDNKEKPIENDDCMKTSEQMIPKNTKIIDKTVKNNSEENKDDSNEKTADIEQIEKNINADHDYVTVKYSASDQAYEKLKKLKKFDDNSKACSPVEFAPGSETGHCSHQILETENDNKIFCEQENKSKDREINEITKLQILEKEGTFFEDKREKINDYFQKDQRVEDLTVIYDTILTNCQSDGQLDQEDTIVKQLPSNQKAEDEDVNNQSLKNSDQLKLINLSVNNDEAIENQTNDDVVNEDQLFKGKKSYDESFIDKADETLENLNYNAEDIVEDQCVTRQLTIDIQLQCDKEKEENNEPLNTSPIIDRMNEAIEQQTINEAEINEDQYFDNSDAEKIEEDQSVIQQVSLDKNVKSIDIEIDDENVLTLSSENNTDNVDLLKVCPKIPQNHATTEEQTSNVTTYNPVLNKSNVKEETENASHKEQLNSSPSFDQTEEATEKQTELHEGQFCREQKTSKVNITPMQIQHINETTADRELNLENSSDTEPLKLPPAIENKVIFQNTNTQDTAAQEKIPKLNHEKEDKMEIINDEIGNSLSSTKNVSKMQKSSSSSSKVVNDYLEVLTKEVKTSPLPPKVVNKTLVSSLAASSESIFKSQPLQSQTVNNEANSPLKGDSRRKLIIRIAKLPILEDELFKRRTETGSVFQIVNLEEQKLMQETNAKHSDEYQITEETTLKTNVLKKNKISSKSSERKKIKKAKKQKQESINLPINDSKVTQDEGGVLKLKASKCTTIQIENQKLAIEKNTDTEPYKKIKPMLISKNSTECKTLVKEGSKERDCEISVCGEKICEETSTKKKKNIKNKPKRNLTLSEEEKIQKLPKMSKDSKLLTEDHVFKLDALECFDHQIIDDQKFSYVKEKNEDQITCDKSVAAINTELNDRSIDKIRIKRTKVRGQFIECRAIDQNDESVKKQTFDEDQFVTKEVYSEENSSVIDTDFTGGDETENVHTNPINTSAEKNEAIEKRNVDVAEIHENQCNENVTSIYTQDETTADSGHYLESSGKKEPLKISTAIEQKVTIAHGTFIKESSAENCHEREVKMKMINDEIHNSLNSTKIFSEMQNCSAPSTKVVDIYSEIQTTDAKSLSLSPKVADLEPSEEQRREEEKQETSFHKEVSMSSSESLDKSKPSQYQQINDEVHSPIKEDSVKKLIIRIPKLSVIKGDLLIGGAEETSVSTLKLQTHLGSGEDSGECKIIVQEKSTKKNVLKKNKSSKKSEQQKIKANKSKSILKKKSLPEEKVCKLDASECIQTENENTTTNKNTHKEQYELYKHKVSTENANELNSPAKKELSSELSVEGVEKSKISTKKKKSVTFEIEGTIYKGEHSSQLNIFGEQIKESIKIPTKDLKLSPKDQVSKVLTTSIDIKRELDESVVNPDTIEDDTICRKKISKIITNKKSEAKTKQGKINKPKLTFNTKKEVINELLKIPTNDSILPHADDKVINLNASQSITIQIESQKTVIEENVYKGQSEKNKPKATSENVIERKSSDKDNLEKSAVEKNTPTSIEISKVSYQQESQQKPYSKLDIETSTEEPILKKNKTPNEARSSYETSTRSISKPSTEIEILQKPQRINDTIKISTKDTNADKLLSRCVVKAVSLDSCFAKSVKFAECQTEPKSTLREQDQNCSRKCRKLSEVCSTAQLTNVLQNIVQCKDELIKNRNQEVFSQIRHAKLENSIEPDSSSQLAKELQRTENTLTEEESNLSTRVQVADLGEPSLISDSEISQQNASVALESDKSIVFYPSRDSAEDQEVSCITSQKNDNIIYYSYNDGDSTPVMDEKNSTEDESPSNPCKITSLNKVSDLICQKPQLIEPTSIPNSEPKEHELKPISIDNVKECNDVSPDESITPFWGAADENLELWLKKLGLSKNCALNRSMNVSNSNSVKLTENSFENQKNDRKQKKPQRVEKNLNFEDFNAAAILTSLKDCQKKLHRSRKGLQPTRITRSASHIAEAESFLQQSSQEVNISPISCSENLCEEDRLDNMNIIEKSRSPPSIQNHSELTQSNVSSDSDDTGKLVIDLDAKRLTKPKTKEKPKSKKNKIGKAKGITSPKTALKKNKKVINQPIVEIIDENPCIIKRCRGRPKVVKDSPTKNIQATTATATQSRRETAKQKKIKKIYTEYGSLDELKTHKEKDEQAEKKSMQKKHKLRLSIDIPLCIPKDPKLIEEQNEEPRTSSNYESSTTCSATLQNMNQETWLKNFTLRKTSKSLDSGVKQLSENVSMVKKILSEQNLLLTTKTDVGFLNIKTEESEEKVSEILIEPNKTKDDDDQNKTKQDIHEVTEVAAIPSLKEPVKDIGKQTIPLKTHKQLESDKLSKCIRRLSIEEKETKKSKIENKQPKTLEDQTASVTTSTLKTVRIEESKQSDVSSKTVVKPSLSSNLESTKHSEVKPSPNSNHESTKHSVVTPSPNSNHESTKHSEVTPSPNSNHESTKHSEVKPSPNSNHESTKHSDVKPSPNSNHESTKHSEDKPSPNSNHESTKHSEVKPSPNSNHESTTHSVVKLSPNSNHETTQHSEVKPSPNSIHESTKHSELVPETITIPETNIDKNKVKDEEKPKKTEEVKNIEQIKSIDTIINKVEKSSLNEADKQCKTTPKKVNKSTEKEIHKIVDLMETKTTTAISSKVSNDVNSKEKPKSYKRVLNFDSTPSSDPPASKITNTVTVDEPIKELLSSTEEVKLKISVLSNAELQATISTIVGPKKHRSKSSCEIVEKNKISDEQGFLDKRLKRLSLDSQLTQKNIPTIEKDAKNLINLTQVSKSVAVKTPTKKEDEVKRVLDISILNILGTQLSNITDSDPLNIIAEEAIKQGSDGSTIQLGSKDNNEQINKKSVETFAKRKRPSLDGVQSLGNVSEFRRRRSNSTSDVPSTVPNESTEVDSSEKDQETLKNKSESEAKKARVLSFTNFLELERDFFLDELNGENFNDTREDQSSQVPVTPKAEPASLDCMFSGNRGQDDEYNLHIFNTHLALQPVPTYSPDENVDNLYSFDDLYSLLPTSTLINGSENVSGASSESGEKTKPDIKKTEFTTKEVENEKEPFEEGKSSAISEKQTIDVRTSEYDPNNCTTNVSSADVILMNPPQVISCLKTKPIKSPLVKIFHKTTPEKKNSTEEFTESITESKLKSRQKPFWIAPTKPKVLQESSDSTKLDSSTSVISSTENPYPMNDVPVYFDKIFEDKHTKTPFKSENILTETNSYKVDLCKKDILDSMSTDDRFDRIKNESPVNTCMKKTSKPVIKNDVKTSTDLCSVQLDEPKSQSVVQLCEKKDEVNKSISLIDQNNLYCNNSSHSVKTTASYNQLYETQKSVLEPNSLKKPCLLKEIDETKKNCEQIAETDDHLRNTVLHADNNTYSKKRQSRIPSVKNSPEKVNVSQMSERKTYSKHLTSKNIRSSVTVDSSLSSISTSLGTPTVLDSCEQKISGKALCPRKSIMQNSAIKTSDQSEKINPTTENKNLESVKLSMNQDPLFSDAKQELPSKVCGSKAVCLKKQNSVIQTPDQSKNKNPIQPTRSEISSTSISVQVVSSKSSVPVPVVSSMPSISKSSDTPRILDRCDSKISGKASYSKKLVDQSFVIKTLDPSEKISETQPAPQCNNLVGSKPSIKRHSPLSDDNLVQEQPPSKIFCSEISKKPVPVAVVSSIPSISSSLVTPTILNPCEQKISGKTSYSKKPLKQYIIIKTPDPPVKINAIQSTLENKNIIKASEPSLNNSYCNLTTSSPNALYGIAHARNQTITKPTILETTSSAPSLPSQKSIETVPSVSLPSQIPRNSRTIPTVHTTEKAISFTFRKSTTPSSTPGKSDSDKPRSTSKPFETTKSYNKPSSTPKLTPSNAGTSATRTPSSWSVDLARLSADLEMIKKDISQLPEIDYEFRAFRHRKSLLEKLKAKQEELNEFKKRHQEYVKHTHVLKSHSERKPFDRDPKQHHHHQQHRSNLQQPNGLKRKYDQLRPHSEHQFSKSSTSGHSSHVERQKQQSRVYVNKFSELDKFHFTNKNDQSADTKPEAKKLPPWDPKTFTADELIRTLRRK